MKPSRPKDQQLTEANGTAHPWKLTRAFSQRSGDLQLILTLLLTLLMLMNKAVHISAAAIYGPGEVCVGSVYNCLWKENGLEHHPHLTDAIKLLSKAQWFWPLQRKCQYELLAKIKPSESLLVIDLFKNYQRSKHSSISFFLVRKRGPNLLRKLDLFVWNPSRSKPEASKKTR